MSSDHTFSPRSNLPLVRATVAAPVIAALRAAGVEPAFVLDPLGLNEAQMMDRQRFLPHDVIYQVFQSVSEATSPDFCASVGQSTDFPQFLVLSEVLAEALTLGDISRVSLRPYQRSPTQRRNLFLLKRTTPISAPREPFTRRCPPVRWMRS